ncbi:MAG: glycoside hydrolase family 99-like domain-containing protein [Lachnospiraceae bacterium]|nr:glycoside hydrolase family 99-like domain-containing protein [Lachnospiraceae bacterium]
MGQPNKTKIFAAYLPQFHETEDNNRFWGKGFTDWDGVRNARPQYDGHDQPRVPLNGKYYDLSDVNDISEQALIAKKYGIDGFNIYHYWFKDGKQELQLPAELLLQHKEINIEYFFTWDNNSWRRTWSSIKGNDWAPSNDDSRKQGPAVLCELDYGNEEQWEKHFQYLLQFFKDDRYYRIDGKPVFAFMTYQYAPVMKCMIRYWKRRAVENGINGIYILTNYEHMKGRFKEDKYFVYQPSYSAWSARSRWENRLERYLKIKPRYDAPVKYLYDYDDVWQKIISFSKNNTDVIQGAFVSYDDTPRRGKKALIIKGSSPELFEKNFSKMYIGCCNNAQPFIFFTAWNEWGEGAYLEPDEKHGYSYLECIKRVKEKIC